VLENFSASYITSFYLPPSQEMIMQSLVKQHPNLTVIDVAALMQQVRTIMQKMTNAIQFVFIFSLLSGLAVLYAALVATREARVKEATLLRVLGAKQRQVMMAAVTEFAAIGVLAALPAVIAANILAYYVSVQVLNIPYTLNWQHTILAVLLAIFAVPAASWLVLRGYLNQPPRQILQSI
jgi:putative ABC transport system permease protein